MVQDPSSALGGLISIQPGCSGASRQAFGVRGVSPGAAPLQRAPGAGGDAQAFPRCSLRGPGNAGAKTSSRGIADFPGKVGMLLLAAPRVFTADPALDK